MEKLYIVKYSCIITPLNFQTFKNNQFLYIFFVCVRARACARVCVCTCVLHTIKIWLFL